MSAKEGRISMLKDNWSVVLRKLLTSSKGGTVNVIGVGNPLRRDDGAGIQVIKQLKMLGNRSDSFRIHTPTDRAESLLVEINYETEKALLIDAADFNSTSGSIFCENLKSSHSGFFVTHNIPIRYLPNVSSNLDRIFLLGIQPGDLSLGEGFSEPVSNSIQQVVQVLRDLIGW